jgi:hypothetical protein
MIVHCYVMQGPPRWDEEEVDPEDLKNGGGKDADRREEVMGAN